MAGAWAMIVQCWSLNRLFPTKWPTRPRRMSSWRWWRNASRNGLWDAENGTGQRLVTGMNGIWMINIMIIYDNILGIGNSVLVQLWPKNKFGKNLQNTQRCLGNICKLNHQDGSYKLKRANGLWLNSEKCGTRDLHFLVTNLFTKILWDRHSCEKLLCQNRHPSNWFKPSMPIIGFVSPKLGVYPYHHSNHSIQWVCFFVYIEQHFPAKFPRIFPRVYGLFSFTSASVKSYQLVKVVSGGRAPGKSSSLASPQLLVIEQFHCFGAVRLEKVHFFYCVDF